MNAVIQTTVIPRFDIYLCVGSAECGPECLERVEAHKVSTQEYSRISDPAFQREKAVRYDCAAVPLDDYPDYAAYEALVKKAGVGQRIRRVKKARQMGYFCDRFSWYLHIPDLHAINISKETRSGGVMRDWYRRSIEEMGGAPTQDIPFVPPPCYLHWTMPFGVFLAEEGYRQGEVVTGRKLVGYIYVHRFGEIAIYSLIIGHGEHLSKGVMNLLHHHVMEWMLTRQDPYVQGLKYVMYAGIDQGGQGLQDWKRHEGFIGVKTTLHDGMPGSVVMPLETTAASTAANRIFELAETARDLEKAKDWIALTELVEREEVYAIQNGTLSYAGFKAYLTLKDDAKAERWLNFALLHMPESANLHRYRAVFMLSRKQLPEALASIQHAIALHAKAASYYSTLSMIYFEMKNYTLAIEAARSALALDMAHHPGWLALARAAHRTGEMGLSLEAYEKALTLIDDPIIQSEWAVVRSATA